jgi:mRNA interferase RelE/StbE
MSRSDAYAVVFTASARKAMDRLPLPAAAALYEHLTGPVAENPYRLGKQLDAPFDELLSTRRGEYRALYAVNDATRVVAVVAAVAVAHRRDAYRPR